MAFSGLLALIDDVATIADDVATLTLTASKKTTGLVTDDMAVAAEQTLGLQRKRELPVIGKVGLGSMVNKAVILVPGALAINAFVPWLLTPLLMCGGAFLCFEGVEKIAHKFLPHGDDHDHAKERAGTAPSRQAPDPATGEDAGAAPPPVHADPDALIATHDTDAPGAPVAVDEETLQKIENQRVWGAIRTDFILSAEIVAISLGEVAEADVGFWMTVTVLYVIAVLMTVGVYGLVAILVKLDDAGEALVQRGGGAAGVGRMLLIGTPYLMKAISWIGTIAMLLVGGHLILHGIPPLEHAVHDLIHLLPDGLDWPARTLADFIVGGILGGIVVGVVQGIGALRRALMTPKAA